MTSLRQQIEEILCNCPPNKDNPIMCPNKEEFNCLKCTVDRICAALKARIEKIPKETVFGENWDKGDGAERQLEACKSYLMGELK